jgi:hypothetical protein
MNLDFFLNFNFLWKFGDLETNNTLFLGSLLEKEPPKK